MPSLRRRLILGTIAGSAVVLLAAGVLVYALVRNALVEQLDRSIIDKARLLASFVEQDGRKIDLEFDEFDLREFHTPRGGGYLQLWREDGSVLYRSPSLGGGDLERAGATTETPLYRWLTLQDGRRGRVVETAFYPRPEGHARTKPSAAGRQAISLALARDATPLEAALDSLKAVLFAVGAAAIGVSALILWLVIRHSLAPVRDVADQITRLGDGNLGDRIDAGGVPEELQPVVGRLNELLARLEAAFRRERSFSADVAHELRTPLAGLRATMEVALTRQRSPEDYAEAIEECRSIALGMQAMVENLLFLARLEANQTRIDPQPIFLADLADDAWGTLERQAENRKLQVQWTRGPRQAVMTDPTLSALIVGNILQNAVTYADEGGVVAIEIATDQTAARLRVTNTGSRISSDQTELIFERFWRNDAARTAAGIHCGLGLSLVKRAVSALGGTVHADSTPGGRFEIAVSIPTPTS